jgi:L-lysine 6-transaminase
MVAERSLTKNIKKPLNQYILADGFDFAVDLQRSEGSYLYDATNEQYLLDFFTYFATNPLGHNHPKLVNDDTFNEELLLAAQANPSNSDFYTPEYAKFVQTFGDIAMPDPFEYAFFIAGGALAVENALKVAMDWKVQKNFEKGYKEEKGHQVLHFQDAFHGRSGYTLSLTNTTPDKTRYFTKFDWPRVLNPYIEFPLDDENEAKVKEREEKSLQQIRQAFEEHKDDICAIIIEPIQSEGGDNHFRKAFLQQLRKIADEEEALLIFDEVQNGVGLTGKFWAYQHFDVVPDVVAFGKKMQVCGIIATDRVDDIDTNCFHVPSRINSTWGGNLVDMVRSRRILEIIDEDNLVENGRPQGDYLVIQLQQLSEQFEIGNVRGRGLQCAFDLPTPEQRDKLQEKALEKQVLLLPCGERSIRFRPPLNIQKKEIDKGLEIIEKVLPAVLD